MSTIWLAQPLLIYMNMPTIANLLELDALIECASDATKGEIWEYKYSKNDYTKIPCYIFMEIMWPARQSNFHLSFIFMEMNIYPLSFLCDVCNEVQEHM